MPRPRRRRALFAGLGLLAAVLIASAALHRRYPLPYVLAVLVDQDADYDDVHDSPARAIAAAPTPSPLPVRPAPRVAALLVELTGAATLDAFLAETRTNALLVVHEGVLVLERYAPGQDERSVQNTFSVSKSVASAVLGLAVRDGALTLDTPLTELVPELAARDERFTAITVEHLVDMRSGLRYDDEVAFPFVNADDSLIYYHPDLERVLLERTEVALPPGAFLYNNYNPPLLGLALRRATGEPLSAYLERELWQPLGAAHAAGWTTDAHGLERMESGFHARPRDLARLGLLYLAGGVVDGRRVLPEDWVRATTESREPRSLTRYDGRTWDYRAGWWIVPRSEGRPDFCAIGRHGQFVYVSPQHAAVFVRNGPGRGAWGDRDWTALFHAAAARL